MSASSGVPGAGGCSGRLDDHRAVVVDDEGPTAGLSLQVATNADADPGQRCCLRDWRTPDALFLALGDRSSAAGREPGGSHPVRRIAGGRRRPSPPRMSKSVVSHSIPVVPGGQSAACCSARLFRPQMTCTLWSLATLGNGLGTWFHHIRQIPARRLSRACDR